MKRCLILFFMAVYFAAAPDPGAKDFVEGKASYYGTGFHGKRTANGEIYDKNKYTCAHRKLPFNTLVRVTNLKNNLSITVRVNDRGPYNYSRIIDLSEAAARRIGSYQHGLTTVHLMIPDIISRTAELDSIFSQSNVFDCLGNEDELGKFSIGLYNTSDLVHMLYLANELYLHDDVDKVYIAAKGMGEKRTYFMVISDYKNREDALKGKDYFERKGFTNVDLFKL